MAFRTFHILGRIIPTDQYFSEGQVNHQPEKCIVLQVGFQPVPGSEEIREAPGWGPPRAQRLFCCDGRRYSKRPQRIAHFMGFLRKLYNVMYRYYDMQHIISYQCMFLNHSKVLQIPMTHTYIIIYIYTWRTIPLSKWFYTPFDQRPVTTLHV